MVERTFIRISNRQDVGRLLERFHNANIQAQRENMKETEELTEELIATNVGTLFRDAGKTIPKVHMSGNAYKGKR